MHRQPRSRPAFRVTALTLLAVVVALALLAGAIAGRQYAWTGFGPMTSPKGESLPGKTLWDWLDLLIIPLTLAVGGYLLNLAERRRERRIAGERTREDRQIAEDRHQESTFQTYLGRMGELITQGLLTENRGADVLFLARAYTAIALENLDGPRKGAVIRFLVETSLVRSSAEGAPSIVSLDGLDLEGAELEGFDLQGVDLQGARLKGTNLSGADLRGALGLTASQVADAAIDGTTQLPANVSLEGIPVMRKEVEVDRFRGQGEVRLADGSVVPSGYDVRELETRERIVTNQGEEWLPTGFKSYRCTLQHGGKLHAPLDGSASMFLVMDDGRRLELLWKKYNLQYGVTEVVVTGGLLPPAKESP